MRKSENAALVAREDQFDDEFSLLDLAAFAALFAQWRWLVGITFAGTLVAVVIALVLPKVYEVDARLVPPTKVDVESINVRGYDQFTQQELFGKYFNQLRSADHFRNFLVKNSWLSKLYPNDAASEDEQFAHLYENLSTEVLEPKKKKGEPNDLPPTLLGIKFLTKDEALGVELLNDYLGYTNQYMIKAIGDEGKALRDLEKEKIELKIVSLRNKASMERAARLIKLTEAYNIAEAMIIKKPTTIEALSRTDGPSQTMVSVGTADKNILALMGTEYLQNEIKSLRNRAGVISFIEQIPESQKQLAGKKTEAEISAFKSLVADDPYIDELPGLMSRLAELNQLTFDFNNVQSFRFDKKAMIDGKAEKSKKRLIVVLGFVFSAMMAVFYVLIMNAYRKYRAISLMN